MPWSRTISADPLAVELGADLDRLAAARST